MKNKGFTLVEIIIGITLISIFIGIIFPILSGNLRLTKNIINKSKIEKRQRRIMTVIKRSIESSGQIKASDKDFIFVSNHNRSFSIYHMNQIYKNKSDIGNLLYIETPMIIKKNEKMKKLVLIFHIYLSKVKVYELEKFGDKQFLLNKNENELERNIYGFFEEKENGIFINLYNDNKLKKGLYRDYEKIPRKF